MATFVSQAESSFAQRLEQVENRIAQALSRCGRERSQVTLVAVSKKFSPAHLATAFYGGCRHFGENYVQEFALKRKELSFPTAEATFHLIGHLQSNKARQATELFDVIETIDSPKLVGRLESAAQETGRTLRAFIEVKLGVEGEKSGCRPDEIPSILEAARASPNIRLDGLMTIPPQTATAEQARPFFRQVAELAHQHGLPELSMGMSNDFEVAIEEGATIIRVGTALFGPRPSRQAPGM